MSKINNTETMALNIFKKSVSQNENKTVRDVMSTNRFVGQSNFLYLFILSGRKMR